MFETFGNLFGRKPASKGGPLIREPRPAIAAARSDAGARDKLFSKIIRWRLPDGQRNRPIPWRLLARSRIGKKSAPSRQRPGSWHVALHHIQGIARIITCCWWMAAHLRQTCDGLAVPHGLEEEKIPGHDRQGAKNLDAVRPNQVDTSGLFRFQAGKSRRRSKASGQDSPHEFAIGLITFEHGLARWNGALDLYPTRVANVI